jgi:hypothetical protein
MAYGNINADILQSSTAGTPPQFNDGSGTQTGTLCRAWVNFAGNTTTPSTRASFNVSSITYVSTGVYTINFSNALSDANYGITLAGQRDSNNTGNCNIFGSATYNSLTTTSAKIVGYDNANNQVSLITMCAAFFR